MRWNTIVLCLALASPLAGQSLPQPTARDTLFRKKFYDEANRVNGPRKTVIKKLADSLIMMTPTPPPLPAAPVAHFKVGCDTLGSFLCQFDGTTSTGFKLGYVWDCGIVPNCTPGNVSAFTFTYPASGPRTARLTVRDSLGRQSDSTVTFTVPPKIPLPDSQPPQPDSVLGIIPPALPKSVPDFQPKPCTRSVDVTQVMNLQTAINNAQAGDCLELAPGATWQGNFKLPTRSCTSATGWITIRTKGVLDVPGTRMDSVQAKGFAKIVQANNQYALGTTDPTACWQIMHLNIARADSATIPGLVYHLVVLGFSAGDGNTSLATNPKDIILRRNWIHGTDTGQLVRCIAVNGVRIAIVDNLIDDCHASGFDSQAIEGWNGAGPILIENNFAAGAGENIMFGGAGPANSDLRPCDITIRRNHVYKRPEWKGKFSIKNIFELKNACRLLVEGNVFENSWPASQIGFAIVIKSSTGGTSDTVRQGTTDLTFINNRVNNSALGFNIQAQDCTAQACIVYRVSRVIVQNNLLTGIGTTNGLTGSGWLNPVYSAPNNILMRNNTFVGNTPGRGLTMYLSGGAQADWDAIRWKRNIFAGQADYAIGADCTQPTHMAALDCMIGPGKWTFSENVVSGVAQTYWTKNPPGNTYKATQAEIGLQPNFSAPSFPGIGADIPLLEQKTAGVVTMTAPLAARRPARSAPRPGEPTPADIEFCKRNACTLQP